MSSTPFSISNKLRFIQLWIIAFLFICSSCERHDALKSFSYRIRDYVHASGTNQHFAQADSLKYEQNYPAALKAFSKILGQAQLGRNDKIYALNQLAFICLKLDKNKEAEEFLRQLSKIEANFTSPQQADFLFNKALLALHLIQPQEVEKNLTEALKKYLSIYPDHHLRVAQTRTVLALYYYDYSAKVGVFEKAAKDAFLAFYPKAEDEKSALHPFSAEVHFLMAHRYRSVARDYQAGLSHCEVAEALIKDKVWQDIFLLARCLGVKGLFLKKEQRFQAADSVLNVGLKRLLTVKPQSLIVQEMYRFLLVNAAGRKDSLFVARSKDTTFSGSFAFYLSAIKNHLRAYQQPEVYIKLDELKAYYYAPMHHPDNDSCRAACFRLQKNMNPSLPAYRYYAEEALFFLTRVNVEEENYANALKFQFKLFKALLPSEKAEKIKDWEEIKKIQQNELSANPFGYHHQVGNTYLKKFKKDQKLDDLEEAFEHFVLADSLMSLGLTMGEEGVLAFHQELNDEAYADALESIFLLSQLNPKKYSFYYNMAFRFMERQKSFVLYREDLIEGNEQAKIYLKSIKKEAKQLNLLQTAKHPDAFLKRTLTAFRYQDLLSTLSQKANWKFNQKINTIPEIQTELFENEFIIQYKVIRKEYFLLLAVGKHEVVFEKINNYDSIRFLVNNFQFDIQKSKSTTSNFQYLNAQKLYQKLLFPFEKILPKRDAELIFIPDDILLNLPYDALVKGNPKSKKELYASFLLNNHFVVLAPSWKVWNHNRDEPLPNSKHRAAFFTYDDKNSKQNLFLWTQEWKPMKDFFGSRADLYHRTTCTKENFLKLAYRYKVLHFSLHGESDPKTLRNNKLFFSIEDGNKPDELNGIEISDLDLKGKLAILSACETNDGKITPEGVYSLSRAFIQAGCACTISALWKVNEQATAEILNIFYAYLQNDSPWVALGKAKRKALDRNITSPAHWAGLVATI